MARATADLDKLDLLVDRGLAAIDAGEIDTAETLLDDARGMVGENHVRVLHLAGMLGWAHGDLERATGYLMQAADLKPERADIYLDCAECLFAGDEIEEAEVQVRAALELSDLPREQADDGRLLLAQIRLAADDAEEALEVLGEIQDALKGHPAYLSTHGAALLEVGRPRDALREIEAALAKEPDDADLHYQLALSRRACGDEDGARAAMVRVLEIDLADAVQDGEASAAPTWPEVQELRARLEDVLEQLPDPFLRLVASAPITVQPRATVEQVQAGIDPRSVVCFDGVRKEGETEAELRGIIVMRDLISAVPAGGDADAIESELFYGLVDELQGFFDKDLVLAEG
jgi:predicted Zn-dependent protease